MITGASGGIGSALAKRFAKEGWNLILCYNRSEKKMTDLKDEILAKYHCTPRVECLDLTDGASVAKLFEVFEMEKVSVDLLINNAGISYVGLLQDMSDEEWQNVINTNLSSCFYTCKGVLPSMIEKQAGCFYRSCILRIQRRNRCLHQGACQGSRSERHCGKRNCLRLYRYFDEFTSFRRRKKRSL